MFIVSVPLFWKMPLEILVAGEDYHHARETNERTNEQIAKTRTEARRKYLFVANESHQNLTNPSICQTSSKLTRSLVVDRYNHWLIHLHEYEKQKHASVTASVVALNHCDNSNEFPDWPSRPK